MNKVSFKKNFNRDEKAAVRLTAALCANGASAYWVGGAVRDFLLGHKIIDIDIATSLNSDEVIKVLESLNLSVSTIGKKFGTVGTAVKGLHVEITTYRKESGYKDGRHPQNVSFVASAEEDSKRRDFTVNGLYLDPINNIILDYVGGLEDLENKKLRFIGDPEKRIKEDSLRLLRAVRFSTTLNFKLDKKSEAAIKKYAYLVKKLPAERVKSELDKIICSNNFYEGIELMEGLGLLAVIFPELERLKSVKQSDNFHAEGNAFIHSMRAFKSLWSKNKDLDISLDDPQKVFRYAVLFHDLGKFGSAKSTIRDGRKHMSFPEHGPKGADIFLGIAKRLKFPTAEKQQIVLLIQHHMDMRRPAEINDQTIAKWIVSNPNLESMIALRYIDDLGSIRTNVDGKIIAQDFSALDIFAKKVKLFKKRSAKNLLTGDDIMNILDLKESEEVGRYMSKIKEMQILGMVKNKEDAIMELKNLWKNQKIY